MYKYKIAISGSTGLIGKKLIDFLSGKSYEVIQIVRKDFESTVHEMSIKLQGCKAIINLAGSPVIQRWTNVNKGKILESRVVTTERLLAAVKILSEKPELYINASAIGIYDSIHKHTEESVFYDNGFIGEVVRKWEEAALQGKEDVVRMILMRIGIVLSLNGGAIEKMKQIFRFGMGGYLGNGKQKMAFIQIEDLCRIVEFLITNKNLSGPVNAVAPRICSNREFSKSLARFYGWNHLFVIPGFGLKIIYGKASETLLSGQDVVPEKLLDNGFTFQYPDIVGAVNSLKNEQKS